MRLILLCGPVKTRLSPRILFRIRCSANIVTSVSPIFAFTPPSKYRVGGGKQEFSSFFECVYRSDHEARAGPNTSINTIRKGQVPASEWRLEAFKCES